MLLSTFLSAEESLPLSAPASFGGNIITANDQTQEQAAQMTKPSHQAPIHRGSLLSMPGSVHTSWNFTNDIQSGAYLSLKLRYEQYYTPSLSRINEIITSYNLYRSQDLHCRVIASENKFSASNSCGPLFTLCIYYFLLLLYYSNGAQLLSIVDLLLAQYLGLYYTHSVHSP